MRKIGNKLAVLSSAIELGEKSAGKSVNDFNVGDTVKVHARIIEGVKERIQIFEGAVIRRNKGVTAGATFTVRKISYNIGVERTFFLHSPRVEKIELVQKGKVRRARLFYLRDLRGKAARIKGVWHSTAKAGAKAGTAETSAEKVVAEA